MKKIIISICLFTCLSSHASINRTPNSFTYCANERGGVVVIDWDINKIAFTPHHVTAHDFTYIITKESTRNESNNGMLVITAVWHYSENSDLEFKLFSSSRGDFMRFPDIDTGLYKYHAIRLDCWNENK